MKFFVIDGPNMNLLGQREPEKYGNKSLQDIRELLVEFFPEISFRFFQSNVEGELVNAIQQADTESDGIIINPAAYSHTSVAIADALASVSVPKVEVHLTNIHAREEYRQKSLSGARCEGVISGLGPEGYILAARWLKGVRS